MWSGIPLFRQIYSEPHLHILHALRFLTEGALIQARKGAATRQVGGLALKISLDVVAVAALFTPVAFPMYQAVAQIDPLGRLPILQGHRQSTGNCCMA